MQPMLVFVVPLFLAVFDPVAARVHYALAEDLFAFPKYRVTFLNGLPVLNDTAQRWLSEGIKGGEREFLDNPSHDFDEIHPLTGFRTIAGQEEVSTDVAGGHDRQHQFTLQHMKMSEKSAYICLIPPPVEEAERATNDQVQEEPSPAQSWSLLQPLSGSCLYHRQGWFTYAYCHNNHVRQFREMAHSHPHPPGYVPEEDPEWEAYTLGQSIGARDDGRDLAVAQQAATANNVDIVTTAGHRYLVQRWGDGTMCDKTNSPREIEVQFHCSMIMTDTILFVKETKTCHYVMIIHTPRLCGEPGFKTRLEQREEAFIRCREIVDSPDAFAAIRGKLPESSFPIQRRVRNNVISPPPPAPPPKMPGIGSLDNKQSDAIKKVLEAFLTGRQAGQQNHEQGQQGSGGEAGSAGDAKVDSDPSVQVVAGKDGEFYIEFLDFVDADAEVEAGGTDAGADSRAEAKSALEKRLEDLLGGKLEQALRAAGIDVVTMSQEVVDLDASPDDVEGNGENQQEQDITRRGKKGGTVHEEL